MDPVPIRITAPDPEFEAVMMPLCAGVNRHAGGVMFARLQRNAGQVRCACAECGCHTFATPGLRMSGGCGNCGATTLHPVAGVEELVPIPEPILEINRPPRRRISGRRFRFRGRGGRLAAA